MDCNDNDTNNIPNNNVNNNLPGLFLLESLGIPGGDVAGSAVSTGDGKSNNKKYLTDEEKEKLKNKKVHVHLQG